MKQPAAIAILGGTFDPIHNGHLSLALHLHTTFGFESVRLLPAYQPVHRSTPGAGAKDRIAMLKLAIQANPAFSVDSREIDRGGPSYMIDTLISLREEFGTTLPLCLVMAADAFMALDRWHRWQALIQYAHLFVVQRPHYPLVFHSEVLANFVHQYQTQQLDLLKTTPANYLYISNLMGLPISATEIRDLIHHHKSIAHLVPATVLAYIKQHQLYGMK